MKKLLLSIFVLSGVVLIPFPVHATFQRATLWTMLDPTQGKSINVAIYDGKNRVDRHLLALSGSSAGFSGGWGYSLPGDQKHYQLDENYKVVADAQGHFHVTMHRVVEQNGVKTTTDRILPVWNKEPAPANRIKLEDGSMAVAYLGT